MEVTVKPRTLGPVELSFIADRVVNCLSRQGQPESDELADVFTKAAKFLEIAAQGGETLRTGRLSLNASNGLRNYGWTARAYAFLADKYNRPKSGDLVPSLRELQGVLMAMAKGEAIAQDKAEEIKQLFALIRDITLAIDTYPTDRTTVIPFSPKGLQ